MVTYNCCRCGYSTDLKGNIRRHFTKKKTCKAVLKDVSLEVCYKEQLGENIQYTLKNAETPPIHSKKTLKNAGNSKNINNCEHTKIPVDTNTTCIYCKTTFQHRRYLEDHMRRSCKIIKSRLHDQVKPYIKAIESMKEILNQERLMRERDKEIIDELKNQINVLLKGKGNVYNYSQNIIVQPFGKENLSYIQDDYVKELISNEPMTCIPRLLQHIHFNSDHQENRNIKIPNKNQSMAQVYNGVNWEYTDKQSTITNMTDRAINIITEHYNMGSNKYMDHITDKICENDRCVVKKIHKGTELMILNNQE
tara:strand:+ start:8409 stop:9332 length:924 start_codon:yes stop_codon:yes gene_type:complete